VGEIGLSRNEVSERTGEEYLLNFGEGPDTFFIDGILKGMFSYKFILKEKTS
jgi:hypothetical protein